MDDDDNWFEYDDVYDGYDKMQRVGEYISAWCRKRRSKTTRMRRFMREEKDTEKERYKQRYKSPRWTKKL